MPDSAAEREASDQPAPDSGAEPTAAAGDGGGGRAEEPTGTPDARLADALERVAHGAVVSVPSILAQQALTLAFAAVLTNGFTAAAYGLFVVARRLQTFLAWLALGFRSGMSRYLPSTDADAERDAIITFAATLLVGVGTLFGAALYVAAPTVTGVASGLTSAGATGPQFVGFLRVFAVGLPAVVWLFTVEEMLRGVEAVGPLNAVMRLGFPGAQLLVGVGGVLAFDSLTAVAWGVVGVWAVAGLAGAGWLAYDRGVRPRWRVSDGTQIRRRYLRFTLPLFVVGFATVTQRLGFYPLAAVYLSSTAGGIFAVGTLIGMLVRLPLMGINQFIPPVAAALHESDHREALSRLYAVTSRLVLVGVTGIAVPVVVYREAVMGVFGPAFVEAAWLLPGFVLAQYLACAAGSVGILLTMTDNQRALLVTNAVVTGVLVVVAIPLTATYGLSGLVATFLLMLALNNGLEVAVLYRFEGLQPLRRGHLKPLVAGVPLAGVTLGVKMGLGAGSAMGAVVGSLLGLAVYGFVVRELGLDPAERRLLGALGARYREALSR